MSRDADGRPMKNAETAGVIARPPVLFLVALLCGLALDWLFPLSHPVPQAAVGYWIGAGSLAFLGLALAAAGIRDFARAETPVPTNEPTRWLVTTGMHGWTRNPIYLGMFLLYGGIGLVARSPWALLLTAPLALAIRYGVVAREEAYLERRFGGAYRDYKSRVRRWL